VFLLSMQNEVKLLEGGATWPPEIGLYKQIQRPNPEFWPNLQLHLVQARPCSEKEEEAISSNIILQLAVWSEISLRTTLWTGQRPAR
jgi:hypothetical protein